MRRLNVNEDNFNISLLRAISYQLYGSANTSVYTEIQKYLFNTEDITVKNFDEILTKVATSFMIGKIYILNNGYFQYGNLDSAIILGCYISKKDKKPYFYSPDFEGISNEILLTSSELPNLHTIKNWVESLQDENVPENIKKNYIIKYI